MNDLLVHHQGQLKRLNEDHAMEKQEIISEWQKKLANELTAVKDNHQQEIAIKSELLNKAETELKHYVLEAETKDKDLNEMTEFIEATSAEYEKRLKNMRREFDAKLEEMKCNVDSTHEVEIRGIQESLSKQHTEELGRLKEEHEKVMPVKVSCFFPRVRGIFLCSRGMRRQTCISR